MAARDRLVAQPAIAPPQRQTPKKKRFTMRHLWRMTLWGTAAAGTLVAAALASRSEMGSQRLAAAFPSLIGHAGIRLAAARPFDARAETRRLAAAVRDLTAENGQLTVRLAKVEHTMNDITGAISRQVDAAKAQSASPSPADAKPASETPAVVGSIVSAEPAPGPLPSGLGAPPVSSPTSPASPSPSSSPPSPAQLGSPAPATSEYGVDIGSALSIQVLRARWLGIRSAHLQLFERLQPTVTLDQSPQSKRLELRLVAGPLASVEAAKRLCAALAPYRLFCRPTIFDRGQLALR
jgi:hypothetical protein